MTDDLFTQTHQRGQVNNLVSGRAWLQAMLDAESALAGACAEVGIIPTGAAEAIAAACADAGTYDDAQLGLLAARTGNPVVGLVAAIRERLPDEIVVHVHCGATSQDIVDTAAMLVTRRAIRAVRVDLAGAAQAGAALAERYRDTPMVARTLLQQAVPITFGLKAAQWLHALARVSARLDQIEVTLPAQLGGAAGTLHGYSDPDTARRVGSAFARRLGLVAPQVPWHTMRYPIGELAGSLATTAGILGKIALDLVLLAQNEVDELSSDSDGRGASSTMAHKRNPVAAVAARSAAKRAPGLAATLFAAMEQEHERAAGAWQAEWPTLSDLLICVGSAAAWLREALAAIKVDEGRMAANLASLGSSASTGSAAQLVDRVLADYRATTGKDEYPADGNTTGEDSATRQDWTM